MDEHAQLRALLDLAESLGITVRHAPRGLSDDAPGTGDRPAGALVRLRGKDVLFLDASAPLADRIAAAAAALKDRRELDGMFLPPEVRQLIEGA